MTAATEGHGAASEWRLRRASRVPWALVAVAGAVVCGGLVRAAMAGGDLWLDEVWSLDLAQQLSSAMGVFTDISHDNNHFLNTLWLFWLGPDRAPWVYRAPSVVYGMLSVALAAAIVWRRSRVGAVVAAVLAALALPLAVYGSEARGYGGLIAALLLAIAAFERALEAPEGSRRARRAGLILGVAIGLGTLFHLTMLAGLAVLGLAALIHFSAQRPLARALEATLALFRPALVCLVPAMAAVVAGILRRGGFETGDVSPASLDSFVHGYGDQLRFMLGLPATVPRVACFAGMGLLLGTALRITKPAPARCAMALAALVACPATMLLLRLPNLAFPRYYLVSGIVLLLLVADLVGALWDRGTWRGRLAALVLAGLGALGHSVADDSAIQSGLGRYGEALATMADPDGRVRFATQDTFWVLRVAEVAARQRGLRVTLVPETDFCRQSPEWIVSVPEDGMPVAPDELVGLPGCRMRYGLWRSVAGGPLSGMPWSIYRKAGGDSPGPAFGLRIDDGG